MDSKEVKKKSRAEIWPQIIAVSIKNTLLLTYGMTLGYPTILIPGLRDSVNDIPITTVQISWIGSISLICVPLGCTISGMFSQAVGRKRAMQFVNVPISLAWLCFYLSTEVWHLLMALALTGLTGGLLEAPVLTYVAEIAQPHMRGMLSSTSSTAVIFGVLIQFFMGTFLSWRNVALVSLFFPIVSILLLFIVPESPHWLIDRERYDDAQNSLAWLRGTKNTKNIQPEYLDLLKQLTDHKKKLADSEHGSCVTTMKLFLNKSFLWPFSLISFIFWIAHFSGMSSLMVYAVQTFETLRVPMDKYYCTLILGVAQLMGCLVTVALVHYIGKRMLCFISLTGNAVLIFLVAVYAYFIEAFEFQVRPCLPPCNQTIFSDTANEIVEFYSWVPMICLIGAVFVISMGIRVLPWILTGEIYSNETRSAGSGFSSAMGYISGFISNKLFLTIVAQMTLPGAYVFYSSVAAFGLVILYFWLPETEGKTLAEINEHFSGGKHMGNNVIRKKREIDTTMDRQENGYAGATNLGFEGDSKKEAVKISRL